MSLRIAAVILALVVLPGIVFAVAKNHPASHPIVGWTAYAPPGATTSSGTGYVSGTTTGDTTAEKAAIKFDVAKWESHHPGGTCQIALPDSAHCTTANGLPADLGVLVSTTVVQATAP